jgi:hypothetical protein
MSKTWQAIIRLDDIPNEIQIRYFRKICTECYHCTSLQGDTKCGYEVPGVILLQSYLHTYSLLRGITFEVLPLSSYALSPTMLLLLEIFGIPVVE